MPDVEFNITDFDGTNITDYNDDNVVWKYGDEAGNSLIMTSQNNLTPINAVIGINT